MTENGLFGHSNCAHVVEDEKVAEQYLRYWQALKRDMDTPDMKKWVGEENDAPPEPWSKDVEAVFSPRRGLEVLQWYANIAGEAHQPLFMTFAFGMHEYFQRVYEQDDGVLRVALMEKEGNGAGLEKGKKDIRRIRSLPNVIVAVANNITTNSFDRWLKERQKLTAEAQIKWIHTKYMLVDPLGKLPVVITGSANFSAASTNTNDENMLVIRNDQRTADIYVGEFMRLYSAYAFREAVAIARRTGEEWSPQYLDPSDGWQRDHFKKGHQRFLRRQYFAGN